MQSGVSFWVAQRVQARRLGTTVRLRVPVGRRWASAYAFQLPICASAELSRFGSTGTYRVGGRLSPVLDAVLAGSPRCATGRTVADDMAANERTNRTHRLRVAAAKSRRRRDTACVHQVVDCQESYSVTPRALSTLVESSGALAGIQYYSFVSTRCLENR
jgi:hypothetical protein